MVLPAAAGTPVTPGEPAAAEEPPPAAESKPATRLPAEQLAIWNDPEFQRRFTESYVAETEIEPRVTSEERDRMQEVLERIAADDMDGALKLLNKHGGPTASAVFDFTGANIHFQRDELEAALEGYRQAVAKFPKFRRAWKNLGLIRLRRNEFQEAGAALTRVISLGGGDALTYGLLGFCYSNLDRHVAAETAYRMASLLDPESTEWKLHLTRSFFQQHRYADAVALCDSLIAENPAAADLWLLQANAYIGLEQPLAAAENLELVDRLGASTFDSLTMLGDIYVNEALYGLAVEAYVRALGMKEDAPVARFIRAAKVLTARGALDETRTLVAGVERLRGEQLDPDERIDLLKLKARLAVAAGADDEQVQVLESIVELDPLDGEALILLGQSAARTGDVEQAIFYYERAETLEGFEADAKVRHAQLLVGQSRYDEALVLLRRAQKLQPRENIQEYLEQVERIANKR